MRGVSGFEDLRVWGRRFGVSSLGQGLKAEGAGYKVWGAGCRGRRIGVLRFRAQGSGSRVQSFNCS